MLYFIPLYDRSREILTGSPVSEDLTHSLSQPKIPVNVTLKLESLKGVWCRDGTASSHSSHRGDEHELSDRQCPGPGLALVPYLTALL